MKRLLSPGAIPNTLWDASSKVLRISPALASAYIKLVEQHKLEDVAKSRAANGGPIGGTSKDETDKHFAQQFDGSCARVQLALIDPNEKMTALSNGIVKTLSGEKLVVLDAPCGAGAAAFGVLGAIVELRAKGVLPREPLDVCLIGRELSDFAREYARELLMELQPKFEEQAVFVDGDFDTWDATCEISTADFVRRINITSTTHSRILLLVANFSGFLKSEHNWKKAKPQLGQLFLHASGENNFAAWIEPNLNKVTNESGGLFSNIRKALSRWRRYASESGLTGLPSPTATDTAKFELPLNNSKTAEVRLAVMPIDLIRQP